MKFKQLLGKLLPTTRQMPEATVNQAEVLQSLHEIDNLIEQGRNMLDNIKDISRGIGDSPAEVEIKSGIFHNAEIADRRISEAQLEAENLSVELELSHELPTSDPALTADMDYPDFDVDYLAEIAAVTHVEPVLNEHGQYVYTLPDMEQEIEPQ